MVVLSHGLISDSSNSDGIEYKLFKKSVLIIIMMIKFLTINLETGSNAANHCIYLIKKEGMEWRNIQVSFSST